MKPENRLKKVKKHVRRAINKIPNMTAWHLPSSFCIHSAPDTFLRGQYNTDLIIEGLRSSFNCWKLVRECDGIADGRYIFIVRSRNGCFRGICWLRAYTTGTVVIHYNDDYETEAEVYDSISTMKGVISYENV